MSLQPFSGACISEASRAPDLHRARKPRKTGRGLTAAVRARWQTWAHFQDVNNTQLVEFNACRLKGSQLQGELRARNKSESPLQHLHLSLVKRWELRLKRNETSNHVHARGSSFPGNKTSKTPVVADVHRAWRGGLCSRALGPQYSHPGYCESSSGAAYTAPENAQKTCNNTAILAHNSSLPPRLRCVFSHFQVLAFPRPLEPQASTAREGHAKLVAG